MILTTQKYANGFPTYDDATRAIGAYKVEEDFNMDIRMPLASSEFAAKLQECIKNNYKIKIDEDCDIDGYFAGRAITDTLNKLGYKNYEVARHVSKRHILSEAYLQSIVEEGFKLVMIVDSSSNDMEGLKYLSDNGITVLVADHHDTEYIFADYPENVIIVNPRIDKRFKPIEYAELSGCAVTVLLMQYFLQKYHNQSYEDLYNLAYITLYTDSCDMNCKYNRFIANKCRNAKKGFPEFINIFMNPMYDSLNRNFISFKFAPRINALIRKEEFEFVRSLIYDDEFVRQNIQRILEFTEEVYTESKEETEKIVKFCKDILKVGLSKGKTSYSLQGTQMILKENLVCAVLPAELAGKFRNSTGNIAIKLSQWAGRTGVCLVNMSPTDSAGSVRDEKNRNILTTFQKMCYAEGHPPAFGVTMQTSQIDDILNIVNNSKGIFEDKATTLLVNWDLLDMSLPGVAVDPITGEIEDNTTSDEVYNEVYKMSRYNELSGGTLPEMYVEWMVSPAFQSKIKSTIKRSVLKLIKGLEIVSFGGGISSGDILLMKPTMKTDGIQLVVEKCLGHYDFENDEEYQKMASSREDGKNADKDEGRDAYRTDGRNATKQTSNFCKEECEDDVPW